ncbi:MAG: polysaccharide biosynthesis tyrosine autokinase [Devosia sp.]
MDHSEFELRSIFGLLRRQFRLILTTIVAVMSLAAVVAFSLTPVYTSSALIMVDPSNKDLLDPQNQINSASADSARIDSEVELARSDSVLLKVIQEENLIADPEFGVSLGTWARILNFLRLAEPTLPSGEDAVNQTLSKLRGAIHVQRRALTYLISIQASAENRALAADMANAVAQTYIADQVDAKIEGILASRDILQARAEQARQAIVSSENSFDDFVESNIARISQDTGRTDLIALQRQIDALSSSRTQNSSLVNSMQMALRTQDLETIVSDLQSDAIDELEQQRADLLANLESAADGTPTAINLRDELAAIEQHMLDEARIATTSLADQIQENQDTEDTLRQSLRSLVLDQSLSADVLTELYELQRGSEIARRQYETLLSRIQDVEAQADLQIADSRVVSPALAPQYPAFPNKTLILALAGFCAILLGLALAFLYENLIGGFTGDEQLAQVLKLPVAATVPRQRAKSEKESLANTVVTAPLSGFSESIRRIRANIDQSVRHASPDKPPTTKVIMVTSTAPNEGKTTLSLSLARSYALTGQRTLIIDCDLRKPSLHRHLNIESSTGLLDYLSSDGDGVALQSIISSDPLTSATTILGARRSNLPTDQLLSAVSFARLIRAARNSFEVIVLDTPPVGPVIDGHYVAPHADAIVFVTRWATTSQSDVRKAVTGLMAARRPDAQVLAVLNQQDETRSAYYRRYGSYYSYTSD